MKNHSKKLYTLVLIFLSLYFVTNLIFLTRFPFVHSDESWLSGLSRNMADHNDFSVTEPFFDLKERHPHAIKIIFHSIQILFMKILDYNIFSMRLISLIFGLLTLYFIFKLAVTLFGEKKTALGALLLTAFDIQYIYASHFARQEIILVFVLVLSLYLFYRKLPGHSRKDDFLLATVMGLSIGIHPNSFIISLPILVLYGYHTFFTRQLPWPNLFRYLATLGGFALIFIGLSVSFDPDFLANYRRLGQEFEVFNPLVSKMAEFKLFYLKLYHQVSGTYYTPNIKLQFFLFPLILLVSLALAFTQYQKKLEMREQPILSDRETVTGLSLSIVALNAGIILVGRYNQTSIVFQFPLFYLLVAYCLYSYPGIKTHLRHLALGVLVLALGITSIINIAPYLPYSYDNYLAQIGKVVSPQSEVLANLNTEFYFAPGKLHDYRNLAFLKENGQDFYDYIRENGIQYIIYPKEMDIINSERPRWDGMYGRLLYYGKMKEFLENNCTLVYQFSDPIYGMRIVDYMGKGDWKIKIYRVNTEY